MSSDTQSKVQVRHLKRSAFLYVRQSSLRQVFENSESGPNKQSGPSNCFSNTTSSSSARRKRDRRTDRGVVMIATSGSKVICHFTMIFPVINGCRPQK